MIKDEMLTAEPIPQYFLFKEYNSAVLDFFKKVVYLERFDRNNNVRVFYSTPRRAWAKYVSPLINGFPNTPIITFYMSQVQTAQNQTMSGWATFEENHPTDENKKLFTYAPIIQRLQFNVTLWSLTINDMDAMISQILMYSSEPMLWAGKINDKVWYQIGNDGSVSIEDDMEPAASKDKTIRRGLNLYIPRAYLPRVSFEEKIIKSLNVSLENDLNGESFGEINYPIP